MHLHHGKVCHRLLIDLGDLHVNLAKALMASEITSGHLQLAIVHGAHAAVFRELFFLVAVVVS